MKADSRSAFLIGEIAEWCRLQGIRKVLCPKILSSLGDSKCYIETKNNREGEYDRKWSKGDILSIVR